MKARVKSTGEIVDIAYTYKTVGTNPISKCETLKGKRYNEEDLDFNIEDDNTPDYWTRLKHQYAGMAMQTMLATLYNPKYHKELMACYTEVDAEEVARLSKYYTHALVEKLKEKEE